MFIFDFVAETILDQILDWIYGKIIGLQCILSRM